jgi:hypothetical protein
MAPKKVAPQMKKKAKKAIVPKKQVPRTTSEIQSDASAYARCLLTPFNAAPCHIPDPDVAPSGTLSSHYTYTGSVTAAGTASTSHSFGFIVYPYPYASWSLLAETLSGTGLLSDLVAAGSSRINNQSAPNQASFGNLGYRVRCSGLAARIIYEGTELNRAGRIFGGNLPIVFPAQTVSGQNPLSALTPIFNSALTSPLTVRQSLADLFEIRNPSDRVTEFHWKPSAVPHYQTVSNNINFPTTSLTGGGTVSQSAFASDAGGLGAELGQNALIVIVDGDVTPSASLTSNVYTIEVVWHWEIVPDDIQAVAFDLTPSHSHAAALDMAFNAMARAPVGIALPGGAVNYGTTGVSSGPVTSGWGPTSGFQSGRRNRQ